MNHKVERFENLMYEGCEPHWHCVRCGGYWPFHCYGWIELEEMECPGKEPEEETKHDSTGGLPGFNSGR